MTDDPRTLSPLALGRAVHAHPDQARFWRRRAADAAAALEVPRDLLGGDGQPIEAVDTPLLEVDALARLTRGDATLRVVLAAAVTALVAARAADADSVRPLTARPDGQCFPLSIDVASCRTFRDLLTATRSAYAAAAPNADIPVGFVLAERSARIGDFAAFGAAEPEAAWSFGVTLAFTLAGDNVRLRYASGLFSRETAVRLLTSFVRLAAAAGHDIDAEIAPLRAADDTEAAFLATSGTVADIPALPLHGFLERTASLEPGRIAVRSDDLTYADLNRHANQVARVLMDYGVTRGDAVGVRLPRSASELVAAHAILKAGAAYLPIDLAMPDERLRHVLDTGGVKVVLDDGAGRSRYPDGVTALDVTDRARFADAGITNPELPIDPDDAAYVIFTSGSTGLPKGVEVSHRGIVNRIAWMQRAYPLTTDDVVLHKTPYTFDVSVWEMFWWALAGTSVSVLPSGDERDPERIAAWIAEQRVSVLHFVPSMLAPFLRHTKVLGTVERLASVRTVFCSGEELRSSEVVDFRALLAGARLVNLYGPTEAAVDVTHFDCAAAVAGRPVPIGRPIDNIRLSVLTRAGLPAPLGVPGELIISGVGVARGYRDAPELTAATFDADPDEPGRRRYRTGDLARWLPDGTLEFLGRRDRQVKVRGQRVEPAEVEYALASEPGVVDCAVVAKPDGETGHRLIAYVVADGVVSPEGIRAALSSRLPAILVPSAVVAVPALPTTANGKRDLAALAGAAFPPHRGTPPGTEIGRRLAAVWESVLGVTSVGEEDNFFDLGGDSISAIDVVIAARAAGLSITYQELFAHPRLNDLIDLVASPARRAPAPDGRRVEPFGLLQERDRAALPADAVDAYPLASLQAGLLYETALAEGHGLYHDVVSYPTFEPIDAERLRRAVAAVATRHPALRTSFHPTGFSEPLQIVRAEAPDPLSVVDLSALSESEQDAELDAFGTRELAVGFGPGETAVRVWLHELGERGARYSLSYHAAALDGWSVSTLNRDIFNAYHAADRIDAGPDPVGFADYLRDEREAVDSAEHREYWTSVLDGASGTRLPRLPFEAPESAHDLISVAVRDVDLPVGVTERVRSVAAGLGVPVKSVLLAAHVVVLGFVGGTDDVLTGYEHSGRPEAAGADALLGLFLNTVPLRVDLAACVSWADVVRVVFETEAGLLPYRRFPYAELVRLGGSGAGLDAVFNFTHFRALKELAREHGFTLNRGSFVSQTEFPFRAEFWQDPHTDVIGMAIHYHRREFAVEYVDRIAGYYARTLAALTTEPDGDYRAAPPHGEAELALLTDGFAGRVRELPEGTAVDLFRERARRSPDAVAISDGEADLDYRALAAGVERFAAFLRRQGVRPGDVVAVTLPRGRQTAIAVLGVFRLGAVYLPQDLNDPAPRRLDALEQGDCRFVVAMAADAGALADELSGTPTSVLVFEGYHSAPASADAGALPEPSDPAYVIFTSGSTGRPKGATISHRGMLNHLLAKVDSLGLGPADRIAQVASQCFDISVWQLLAALLVGGRTEVFADPVVADLAAFADRVAERGVTVLEVVPAYLDAVLAEVESRPRALPALRYLMVTGERLPPALTERWFASYPVPMVNAYGPTEASDDVTHHVLTAPAGGERVPVGTAINNTGLHIVDTHGRRCPLGTFGEVVVTGVGVGLGYANAPDLTAAVFVPNVFDDTSATAYRTGDIGRWLPDGTLDCAGRLDEQVKVRGLRIELSEIEGAAARLTGVERAAALVRRDGGGERLVVVHTGPDDLDPAAARRALAGRLPAAMLPDAFVRIAEFPVNRNGKIDREALAGVPLMPDAVAERVAPADAAEAEVLAAFADVLGVSEDTIGVLDNFFAIGGHSLAALKVVSRLRDGAGLADLLAAPTARELARRRRGRRAPLIDLGAAAGRRPDQRAEAVLVCVPFAGGRAVSSLPIAVALAERPVAVFGVEADDAALESLAARVADELGGSAAAAPIVLIGHSSGSALAFLIALGLRRAGCDPRLVIVAHTVPDAEPLEQAADAEILAWLSGTGTPGLDDLAAPGLAALVARFRHDAAESRRILVDAASRPEAYLPASPVTVVLATDDPVTPADPAEAERWAPLAAGLRVVITETGGHHLNTTRPDLIAECALAAASIEGAR